MVKMKKKYIKKEKEDKLNISIEAKIKNNINNINNAPTTDKPIKIKATANNIIASCSTARV